MSSPEYKKLRNVVLVAFVPIFLVIFYNAMGMHFGMKNKVDRIELQKNMYEQQLLFEAKTQALEKMVLEDTDYEVFLEIKTEVRKLNKRIDRHLEEHIRMRTADLN